MTSNKRHIDVMERMIKVDCCMALTIPESSRNCKLDLMGFVGIDTCYMFLRFENTLLLPRFEMAFEISRPCGVCFRTRLKNTIQDHYSQLLHIKYD
jgi:hypothetical protein